MEARGSLILPCALTGALSACTTQFVEFRGECVLQQWALASIVVRRRTLCDLPPPDFATEGHLRDREAMDVNPFPDAFGEENKADSLDPNLLEKTLGVPQEDGGETETDH